MTAYKITTLTLSLILSVSISMASNKGKKAEKISSTPKIEITKQEIFNNVNDAFAKSTEVVVIDANNNLKNTIPVDTKESISEKLYYPKFAQDDQKRDLVVVSFTYTEDGYMDILSINSSDEELNPYIISKLESIRLTDGSVTIGKAYNAKFHFKLL